MLTQHSSFASPRYVARLGITVLLGGAMVVVLAGCGGTPKPLTDTTPTTASTTTTVPGPTEDKIIGDQEDSGPPRFKTCHAVLYPHLDPPRVIGTTDIWSHCAIGGFTGTVAVVVGDNTGEALTWGDPGESWGVNGEVEAGGGGGPNERTVHWQANPRTRRFSLWPRR